MKKTIGSYTILAALLLAGFTSCKKSDTAPVVDEGVIYEVSNERFPNPERGFIKTMEVHSAGQSLDAAQLGLLRSQNVSMIIRFFYLEDFKNQPLSAAELSLVQMDLNKIRDAGLKVILRFAYTDNMAGTDAPYSIIEQHLNQLQPVFSSNKDIIAFVQAGFIGAWGEWHSSSNGLATTDNERIFLNKLLSVLPDDIMVQVRTPDAKRQIFNNSQPVSEGIAYTNDSRARVGHHNDCFLTGGTDYGTYPNITVDKQFVSDEALFVPTGGETCPPQGGYDPSCAEGRTQMKLLKWTYLNLDWYPATIAAWRNSGCFNEFDTYLGHRLALVNSKFPAQVAAGSNLAVNINISNKGYAPLYNKKISSLILKNKATGTFYERTLNADLRKCKPSVTFNINESAGLTGVPAGDYHLYLRIADKADNLKPRPEYAVRLANTNVWVSENGGMNDLKQELKITN